MKKNSEEWHDLLVIGAGPAALSASIYASRYGIRHLIIGELMGGQISQTHLLDNYLAVEEITGHDFSEKMRKHAEKYGPGLVQARIAQLSGLEEGGYLAMTEKGEEFRGRTVLIAAGMKRRKAGIVGEEELLGKGVSYCATCDGFFYKGRVVGVLGGSDSAAGAALFLANIAEKVFVIYRKGRLRAEDYWVRLIEKNKKIEVLCNSEIEELIGQDKLQRVKLKEAQGNQSGKELELDGLFIEIGSEPDFGFAKELGLETDEEGYIRIAADGASSVPGIWAAGDITTGSDKFKQVITAAAEGAIAARSISDYLKKND